MFASTLFAHENYASVNSSCAQSKAWGWPRGWQMPGPWAAQNLQMPHPRDWLGEQMPRSSPGGGGGGAQQELTDALRDTGNQP